MNKNLDEALVRDFPNLFCDRNGDERNTCMSWGFECGDGWEPLIRTTAYKLEPLIIKWKQENPDEPHYPRASQIKEKYGTLRFYMDFETKEMSDIISLAEDKTESICEICGEFGKLRGMSWYYVACDNHTREGDK